MREIVNVDIADTTSISHTAAVQHKIRRVTGVDLLDILLVAVAQSALCEATRALQLKNHKVFTNSLELFSLLRSFKQRTDVNFVTSNCKLEIVFKNF